MKKKMLSFIKDPIDKFILMSLYQLNPKLRDALIKFSALSYHGKSNILKSKNIKYNYIYDSLYFNNNNNNNNIQLIYITPHLIFTHETGKIVVDILSTYENLESVIELPTYRLRGLDGRGVEMFSTTEIRPLSICNLGPTAILTTETTESKNVYDNNPKCIIATRLLYLNALSDLVYRLKCFFLKTRYLPYIIHPHRLLESNITTKNGGGGGISEKKTLKLLLAYLFQYIFSPYCEHLQIIDFDYDCKLFQEETMSFHENDYDKYLLSLPRKLILKFFYSLFLTTVWIANGGRGTSGPVTFLKNNWLTAATTTTTTTFTGGGGGGGGGGGSSIEKKQCRRHLHNFRHYHNYMLYPVASPLLCDVTMGICQGLSLYGCLITDDAAAAANNIINDNNNNDNNDDNDNNNNNNNNNNINDNNNNNNFLVS